jgi:triosephosphate isomerase
MDKLIAGNWKMNGLRAALGEAQDLARVLKAEPASARVAICPPATLILAMSELLRGSAIEIGGQDCRPEPSGAFTGDLSAEMLADAGAGLVILGHSERRAGHGESDSLVQDKARAALRAGLEPIVCVGETLAQRQAGQTLDVVERQTRDSLPEGLKGCAFAIAYEPVWAIGTGLTPTTEQIEEVHAAIRRVLVQRFGEGGREAPILYGGSVKPDNAAEILAAREVGGALVGGASHKCKDFLAIVRAAG